MTSTAYFNDIDELAQFCAALTRAGVQYSVVPGNGHGQYVVNIEGAR